MAFIMTRINVGDYAAWKPLFDRDAPGTRRAAEGYRLFRNVDDPGEVFIQVQFGSAEEATLDPAGVVSRISTTPVPAGGR